MIAIEGKMPYASFFEWIGGEAKVQALVDRFYDLMDLEPAYSHLRSLHQADLQHSRDTLFWFLCGWLGGPSYYEQRYGHPRLRMRHLHVQIAERERDEWVACMNEAMHACQLPDALREQLHEKFAYLADFMRNSNGH